MKRWVAIGIGVLLLLWVPFLYWQMQASPAPQPAPDTEPAPLPPAQPPADRPAPEGAAPLAAPSAELPATQPATAPGATPASEVPSSDPETLSAIKSAYANSSRDGGAGAVEADLRALFDKSGAPADMLRSLGCHAAACKIELGWSRERARAFSLVVLAWTARVSGKVAVESGAADADGTVPVTLYLTRSADQGSASR